MPSSDWKPLLERFDEFPVDELNRRYTADKLDLERSGNPSANLNESIQTHEHEEVRSPESIIDSASPEDSGNREHLFSPEKIPGQVRRALVRTIVMRARVAAILENWRRMETHANHALKEAYDLNDLPLTGLCFFTLGIAFYNQKCWHVASEAFVLALPSVDIYTDSKELDEWYVKTHKGIGSLKTPWTGPLSTARLRQMSVFSAPDSGYPKTNADGWENLAGLASGDRMSSEGTFSARGSTSMRNSVTWRGSLSGQISITVPNWKGWQNFVKFRRPESLGSEIKERIAPDNEVSPSEPMPSFPETSAPENMVAPPSVERPPSESIPSPSKDPISGNTVTSSQGLGDSLPEDNVAHSNSSDPEELRVPRARAISPRPVVILNPSPMPPGRSPLYNPSPSPSPPRTRHLSPLNSTEDYVDTGERPLARVRSRLDEVHNSRNPSIASQDNDLRHQPEQGSYISQTPSSTINEENDKESHANREQRHRTWFGASNLTKKQRAAMERRENEDHHGGNDNEDGTHEEVIHSHDQEEEDKDGTTYDEKDKGGKGGNHDASSSGTLHKKWHRSS